MMSDGMEIFKIVTANRLRDGTIVYMQEDSGEISWRPSIADATPFDEAEIESAIDRAKAFEKSCLIVGIYAAEVAESNRPLGAREEIRAHGPSITYGTDAQTPDYSI